MARAINLLQVNAIRALITLLMVSSLAACSAGDSDSGDAYIGTWHNPKDVRQVLTISREGEHFRIDTFKKPLWNDRAGEPIQVAALFKDGVLLPQGWGGAVAMTHVPESDSLAVQRPAGGTVTFIRVGPDAQQRGP